MGKTLGEINEDFARWMMEQPIYFVATAPNSQEGHVNCSPKGLDTFRVLGPKEVAYLDLTGSGSETIAHVRENGRIVIMFCSFSARPRIMRVHGKGRVVLPSDEEWTRIVGHFPPLEGARSIIVVAVERVAESCGYGVPVARVGDVETRSSLMDWVTAKGPEGVADYQRQKNRKSIDGLPSIDFA